MYPAGAIPVFIINIVPFLHTGNAPFCLFQATSWNIISCNVTLGNRFLMALRSLYGPGGFQTRSVTMLHAKQQDFIGVSLNDICTCLYGCSPNWASFLL
jgi:hypothetical protein